MLEEPLLRLMVFPAAATKPPKDCRHVILVVAENCNLSCRYCSQSRRSGSVMTLDIAKSCLLEERRRRRATDGKTVDVEFFGGEPFLAFDVIRDTVEWAVKHEFPFRFRVQTNGTVLDRGIRRWLERNRDVLSVGLSLDGFSEMNAENRGSEDVDVSFFRRLWPENRVSALVAPRSVRWLSKTVAEFSTREIPFRLSAADGETWDLGSASQLATQLQSCADLPGMDYAEGLASGLWPFDPGDFFPSERTGLVHFCGHKKSMALYDTNGREWFCQMFSPAALGETGAVRWRTALQSVEWIENDGQCLACATRRCCRPCFGWRCKIGNGPADAVEKRTTCLAVKTFAEISAWRFLRELERLRPDPGKLSEQDLFRARMSLRLLDRSMEDAD